MATVIESLALLIQADPGPALKGIGQVEKGIGDFAKQMKSADAAFGGADGLFAALGPEAIAATAGIMAAVGAGKAFVDTLNNISAAYTGPGLASTIAQTAQLADNLGLSTEQLTSWEHAAKSAGLAPAELDNALLKLQKSLSGVEFGSDAVSKKLETFGVNIKGLSEQDALQVIADKFVSMTDKSQQAGLALATFGKSGQGVETFLKKAAAGGLQDMIDKGKLLGITYSRDAAAGVEKARSAMLDYEAAIQGFKQKAIIAAAPLLTPLFDGITQGLGVASAAWTQFLNLVGPPLKEAFGGVLADVKAWAQGAAPLIGKVASGFKELLGDGQVLRATVGAAWAVTKGFVQFMAGGLELIVDFYKTVSGGLFDIAKGLGLLGPIVGYLFPDGTKTTLADFKERLTDLLATTQFLADNSRDAWKLVWLGMQTVAGGMADLATISGRVWSKALGDIGANIKNFGSAVVKFLKNPAGGFDFAPTFSNAYEYAFSESTLKIKAEADGLFKDLKDKYDKFRNDLRSKPALDFLNSGLGIKVTHNSPGGAAAGTFEPSKFGAAALLGSSEALNAEAKFRFELGGGPASPAEKQLDAQQKGNGLLQDIKQLLKQQGAAPVEFAIG
jgi:hypothetical protein